MKIANIIVSGSKERPMLLDVFLNESLAKKPVVIFCHGYKGFKDWGAWNRVGELFSKAGYNFIKFNFSHNGTTIQFPTDFEDLNAFGENNYLLELADLGKVIDWVSDKSNYSKYFNSNEIYLIGHSRGGGIVLLEGVKNEKISKIITWASVSDFFSRLPNDNAEIEEWKSNGVRYVLNGRTKQEMPHYYQFYETAVNNQDKLDIRTHVSNSYKPMLFIHGDSDQAVSLKESEKLHEWNLGSSIEIIEDGDHTFGMNHPFLSSDLLTVQMEKVIDKSINFFNREV